jgi:hypothetical protein
MSIHPDDIVKECSKNGVFENSDGEFEFKFFKKKPDWWPAHLRLFNSAAGLSTLPAGLASHSTSFVLLSPKLSNQTIIKLLTLLKGNKALIGFRPSDALIHQRVYVVGEFGSDAKQLFEDNVAEVEFVTGSDQELREKLSELLAYDGS